MYSHARARLGVPPDDAAEVLERAASATARPARRSCTRRCRPPARARTGSSPRRRRRSPSSRARTCAGGPRSRCARGCGARCRARRDRRRSCGSRSTRGGGTRVFAAEKSSSQTRTCGSIEPPTSRNSSTFTRLRRSGTRCRSSQPAFLAVPSIVPSRSSSSGTPSRAKRRRRAQRDLDVARVELDVAVEVAEAALVPDLDRAAVAAALLADADALGVVAVGAERAGAAGADPLDAAGVARLLLREPLLQRLHQLVPAAQRLDLRLVLGREQPLELLPQPLLGDLRADVEDRVDALEVRREREVEAVEERLVLDQARRARDGRNRRCDSDTTRASSASSSVRNSRVDTGSRADLRWRKKSISIAPERTVLRARTRHPPERGCCFTAGHSLRDDAEHDGVAQRAVRQDLVVAQDAVLLRAEPRDRRARRRS